MFRRTLTASSRAISSTSRTVTQRPLARPQFSPAPLNPLRTISPARTRWYSDQPEAAEKKNGEETTPEAETKDSPDANAPPNVEGELKKKLEAKEKEASDWKVRVYLRHNILPVSAHLKHVKSLTYTRHHRINTFGPWPISETFKTVLSVK